MIIALAGGVGGAKLVNGLSAWLRPDELSIIVNTGDDFKYWGLSISPDLDSVMYNLAGINNTTTGWGIQDESWQTLAMMKRLNTESWFQIGDKDLATHLIRTSLLREDKTLSVATKHLCEIFHLKHILIPMTDQNVHTKVHTENGIMDFQDYFVKYQCKPVVSAISYVGASSASMSDGFYSALSSPTLKGIIICPSNPLLSIAPILAIPKVLTKIKEKNVPVIAVSPLIQGKAVKGPAAKIMSELNINTSVISIADYYKDFITDIVIDVADANYETDIQNMHIKPHVTNIIMRNHSDSITLAQKILQQIGYN